MSAPLFRLAGSGWYETDFKSDKEQKRNLLEKGEKEPAKAEGTSGSKADKPAKSEAKPSSGESKARTVVTKPAKAPSRKKAAAKPAASKRKR